MDDLNDKPQQNESQNPEEQPDQIVNDEELKNKIIPQISPIAAAFIGLFGGFLLYQIVGGTLTLLIFGLDLDSAPINGIRLMTMAGQILFILLPALLFTKWFYRDVTTILRVRIPKVREILLFTLGIIILTPLLQNYLYIQNYFIEELAKNYDFINSAKTILDKFNKLIEKTYGDILAAKNVLEGILVVGVIALIPALCEEVMFRGFIQRSFEFKLKPVWAALITAVFFGAYHFNFYGMIPLIALGFYFGFAAYMSNSIFVPIVLHFLNNFTAILLFFIFGSDELINTKSLSETDLNSSIIFFFFLLLIFSGVIFLIKKYYSKARNV